MSRSSMQLFNTDSVFIFSHINYARYTTNNCRQSMIELAERKVKFENIDLGISIAINKISSNIRSKSVYQ